MSNHLGLLFFFFFLLNQVIIWALEVDLGSHRVVYGIFLLKICGLDSRMAEVDLALMALDGLKLAREVAPALSQADVTGVLPVHLLLLEGKAMVSQVEVGFPEGEHLCLGSVSIQISCHIVSHIAVLGNRGIH